MRFTCTQNSTAATFTMPATPKKKPKHHTVRHRREQPFFTFEAEWESVPPRTDYQTCIHQLRHILRETTLSIRKGHEIFEQLSMIFLIVKDLEKILEWGEWGGNGTDAMSVFQELWDVKEAAEKLHTDTTGKALPNLAAKVEMVGKRCLEGWFY
jgi:hypothetical protein